jgi:PAS domain S-box-containing protein
MFSTDYELALVAFSVLVALIASCTALNLVQRAVPASNTSATSATPIRSTVLARTRQALLTGGACVMGAGIWSMHFIAMLAFRMPLQVGYDFRIILLSLAMVILLSGLALHLAGTGGRSLWRLGAGALFMGLGIAAMHYIGMASLRLSPDIVYSPQLVVASVAIAVSASGAAFWLAFHLSGDARQRLLLLAMATGAMSLAIVGTYFIGMAAAAFPMESVSLAYRDGIGQGALAIKVIAATLSILVAAMVTALVDRTRESGVRSMSALYSSHQERDTLLNHLPGAVCRYRNDRAWTMEYASEGIRALTGYGPDAFCGKAGITYASLVHEKDRNRIYNDMQEAIYRREPFRLVYRLTTAQQRLKWVSAQGEGLYADDGSLLALQAFIVDITKQKEMEDTSRIALAEATAMLEFTAEGLLVIGLDYAIAAINRRCIDILHLPETVAASLDYESLTTHLLSIVDDAPAYLKSREKLLNYPDCDMHDRILLRDGRLLEWHSRPRLVDGRITGCVICLLDITEQAALEQRLVQAREAAESANQSRSEFFAGMSHEIRTPMNSVVGAARLALHRESDLRQQEYLRVILSSSKHLMRIIEGIFDMSRIESGRVGIDSRRDSHADHDDYAAPACNGLAPPDLKTASILVVEDCRINRMIAGEYLEKTGARVLMAADGQEALDVLASEKVDCVLMDIKMPKMNGLETTRRIRADVRLAGLPVIAMTASVSAEDSAQCRAAGMNDFLGKPLVPEVFYGVLSRTLSTVCTGDRAPEQPVHEEVQGPYINLKVLCDMVQGDPEKLRHFAYRFTASAQANLLDIQKAMEQKNWSALAGLGHRCKSSARAVGAVQFAALCEVLEKMPVALAEQAAPGVVARLQPMLDAIHREVEEWFHATQES